MDSLEMLRKINNKDADAFNEFMNTYGMRVYSRLLRQLGDKTLADEAFKKTMLEFFDTVSHYEGDDIVEAMLFKRADEVQNTMVDGSLRNLIREVKAEIDDAEEPSMLIAEPEHRTVSTVRPAQRIAPVLPKEADEGKKEIESLAEEMTSGTKTAIEAMAIEMAEEAVEAKTEEAAPAAAPVEAAVPAEPEKPGETTAAKEYVPPYKAPEIKEKKTNPLLVLLLLVLLFVIVWLGTGALMSIDIIPKYDLGYEWFNANVYPIFTLLR